MSFYLQTTMVYYCDAAECTWHSSKVLKLHIYLFMADVMWIRRWKNISRKMEGTDSAWGEGQDMEECQEECQWTSWKLPGHVPVISTRKRSALSGDPIYLAWNNWRKPLVLAKPQMSVSAAGLHVMFYSTWEDYYSLIAYFVRGASPMYE